MQQYTNSNEDARRVMEELNYIIDGINEYQEQNEFFRESQKASKDINRPFAPYRWLFGQLSPEYREKDRKIEEEAKLFKSTKKTLDDYIKKEWNPRFKILEQNSKSYYSDKELRDAYSQFIKIDREIQKLTIEGERNRERNQAFNRFLKVAGIGVTAITGLTLGAIGSINSVADRQMFPDH